MAKLGRPRKFDGPTTQVMFILPERIVRRMRQRLARVAPDLADQSDSIVVQAVVVHDYDDTK